MKTTSYVIFLWLCVHFAWGQELSLSYSSPQKLNVCNSDQFELSLENLSGIPISNIKITIQLPLGVKYITGTIQSASEFNILDLSRPIFLVNVINPSQSISASLRIECTCEAFDQANMSQKFQNKFWIEYNNKLDSLISSPPYPIINPFLVITNVPDQSIAIGSNGKRNIKITNTRLGSCSSFILEDHHGPAKISSNQGNVISATNVLLQIQFGPADFVKIGDHDSLFERDEMLLFDEDIEPMDCKAYSITSVLKARWGCGNLFCQEATESATLEFTKNMVNANLNFTANPMTPACICSKDGATQELIIKNTGTGIADSVCIDLYSLRPNEVLALGILKGSLIITGSNQKDSIFYIDRLTSCIPKSGDSLYKQIRICFKEIKIDQEIRIQFKWFTCLPSIDTTTQLNWFYSYKYNTRCTENSDRMKDLIAVPLPKSSQATVSVKSTLEKSTSIEDGKSYVINNEIKLSKNLTNEILSLVISFPCPLKLKDSNFILDSKNPSSIQIENYHQSTIVSLEYKAPFSSNTLMLKLNLIADCLDTCTVGFPLSEISKLVTSCPYPIPIAKLLKGLICLKASVSCTNNEGSCGNFSIGEIVLTIHCDTLNNMKINIPAYLDFSASAKRISRGEKDDNNDRFPELAQLDTNRILDHHFITGDTIRHDIHAKIIVDEKGRTFDSIDFVITHPLTLDHLESEVEYYDVSTEKYYHIQGPFLKDFKLLSPKSTCDSVKLDYSGLGLGNILSITPELLRQYYPEIPSGFKFEEGDSIHVSIIGRAVNTVNDRTVTVDFTYYAFLFDRMSSFVIPLSCGNQKERFMQTTSSHRIEVDQAKAIFCGRNFALPRIMVYGSRHLHNFFPYEFRSLSKVSELSYIINPLLQMDSVRMNFYYTDSNQLRLVGTQLYIPKKMVNWEIDSLDLKLNRYDESYATEILAYGSAEDCQSLLDAKNISAIVSLKITKDFDANFHIDPSYVNLLTEYQFSRAVLIDNYNANDQINFINKTIVSSSKLLTWKAEINNLKLPGYFVISGRSINGLIDSFQIKSSSTGLNIEKLDSTHFKIGPLSAGQNYILDFCARNRSCITDTIVLESFWICGEYSSDANICAPAIFKIPVLNELPEFELDVMQNDMESNLCDTLPEIFIEIYNAAKGTAYQPFLDIEIPQGVQLIPSSLLYAYPSNASYQALPMPIWIGANIYRWNLEDIIPMIKLRGLAGVEDIPNNGIKIRMKAQTECNSNVNGYFVFNIMGVNNCGLSSNSIAKASKSIRIKGVKAPTALQLDFTKDSEDVCKDEYKFTVDILASDILSSKDSISILLPPGISYLNSSYVAIANSKLQIPIQKITGNGTLLIFGFPILPALGSHVIFSFVLKNFSSLPCQDYSIPIQVYQLQSAFCETLQMNCDIQVNRATKEIHINKNLANIQLHQFTIKGNNNNNLKFILNYEIKNIENKRDSSFCIALYNDSNQKNRLDSNDKLIKIYEIKYASLSGNGKYILSADLHAKDIVSCNFICTVVNKSCLCRLDTIYSNLTDTIEENLEDSICFGERIQIGVHSMIANKYFWTGELVPCDTCSLNELVFLKSEQINQTLKYSLEVKNDDHCIRKYNYSIFIYGLPIPAKKTFTVCPIEFVQINAGERKNFKWRGIYSRSDTSYLQNILVVKDSILLLDFSDEHNCKGTDTFCLFVDKLVDSLYISNDTTILLGASADLHVTKNFKYKWTPPDFLNCTDCSDVISTPSRDIKYTVEITDSLTCTKMLMVQVKVLLPNCDSTTFFIPSAFSPNSDNHNDKFYVRGINSNNVHLLVYNRWGEKVFETFDINQGWDGSYKGKNLPPDVFGYYAELECIGGKKFIKKGNVSLLK